LGIGGSLPAKMGRGNGGSETAHDDGEEGRSVAFSNRETAIARFPSKTPMISGKLKLVNRLHIGESPKQSFPAPRLAVHKLNGCSNGGVQSNPTSDIGVVNSFDGSAICGQLG
jgi:hypothetical protein